MSFIGKIDGVPVYSTIIEAVVFGSQVGLEGYHEHILKGVKGYMGGVDHRDIKVAMQNGVTNFLPKNALKGGNYITDASIRDQYIANQNTNKPNLTPAQILKQSQQPAVPKNFQTPNNPLQAPSPYDNIPYYGNVSAHMRMVYPGFPGYGNYEILTFNGQGNLHNVHWPSMASYPQAGVAWRNQLHNTLVNGVTAVVSTGNVVLPSQIPAFGTY